MSKRSKLVVVIPVLLLLVRSLLPVAHGQVLPLEWNHKVDPGGLAYKQPLNLQAADRAFLPSKFWGGVPDPAASLNNRELVDVPIFKSTGLSPSSYLVSQEQLQYAPHYVPSYPSPIDVLQALNNRLVYQQPKKRQQQQKETDALSGGSGPSADFLSDDDTSAQLVQPAVVNSDDFSQSAPSRTKSKQRQPVIANGLARYLIFSNLKRARDGYICHFKLCQVGVSGKRLSNM